jgi:uncharacterized membrane protein required for colicin V production
MVSLSVLFYIFIFIFALIGAIRGWAKEVTALFASVLALFILTVLQAFIPAIKTYMENSPVTSQVTFRMAVVGIIAFLGYQTPNLPVFMQSQQFKRGQMQDVILGFLVGGLNGFMIFGSIWYFMHQGGYPFTYVLAPIAGTSAGEAAMQIIPLLPPNWLVAPGIYFAVALSFLFVLMVFI